MWADQVEGQLRGKAEDAGPSPVEGCAFLGMGIALGAGPQRKTSYLEKHHRAGEPRGTGNSLQLPHPRVRSSVPTFPQLPTSQPDPRGKSPTTRAVVLQSLLRERVAVPVR